MGRKIGTILSYLTLLVEIFTAMFLTPLVIRSFGQAEYGVYTLALSVTAYLSLLDLGVGNSVTRFIAKYRANNQIEEQRRFLGITTVYYLAIAFLVIVLGAVLISLFPTVFATGLSADEIELAQNILVVTIINIAFTLGTSGFFHTVIAYENFAVSKGVSIFLNLVRVAISFVALNLGARSLAIAIINTITSVFTRGIIVLFVLFKMKLLPTLKKVNFAMIKDTVSYSAIILIQMVAMQINNLTGSVFIGIFAASSSVILAVYGVGTQIYQYFQSFGGALNGTLMAGVVKKVEKDGSVDSLQGEMIRIGRFNLLFIAMVWLVFLLFGQQFVILWSGEVNADAYFVALLLTFPFVFILTQNIGTQILWAKNKHQLQAYLKLAIVVINIILTVFLIKWNPLWGASIGTFISLMLGDVLVMQLVFKRDIGIQLLTYYKGLFRGILPSLLVALIFGILIKLFDFSGWLGFFVNCSVVVCVYVICMLLFGFNEYEKNFIKGIINRIFRRTENESIQR